MSRAGGRSWRWLWWCFFNRQANSSGYSQLKKNAPDVTPGQGRLEGEEEELRRSEIESVAGLFEFPLDDLADLAATVPLALTDWEPFVSAVIIKSDMAFVATHRFFRVVRTLVDLLAVSSLSIARGESNECDGGGSADEDCGIDHGEFHGVFPLDGVGLQGPSVSMPST